MKRRKTLCRYVSVAAVAGSLIAAVGTMAASTKKPLPTPSDTGPVPTDIAQQTAQLMKEARQFVGGPLPKDLPAQQAAKARAALRSGDYATADRISATVLAQSTLENGDYMPLDGFVPALAEVTDPKFEQVLDGWVKKAPGSIVPRLVRAEYLSNKGWRVRGGRFADKIRPEQMAAFSQYMHRALADVDAALRIDATNPYAWSMRMSMLDGQGNSPAMRSTFRQAAARFPNYYSLYAERAQTLQTKWGGSPEELYAFARGYLDPLPNNSPSKMAYFDVYYAFLVDATSDCWQYYGPPMRKWRHCFENARRGLIKPWLIHGIRQALALSDHTDRYQFNLLLTDALDGFAWYASKDRNAAMVIQMAADATGSDDQLVEDHPGHNDYVLDSITAEVWNANQDPDSALAKYQEAVRDLAHAPFPGAREKALALSHLYADIADVYYTMSRYKEAIAYRSAATALGGYLSDPDFICRTYYASRQYRAAIKACTETIESRGDLDARYWRAQTYRQLRNWRAARQDYQVVADSEWDSSDRTGAALDLSLAAAKLHDMPGVLKALQEHSYLFDEKARKRDDLAIAYNNRCYAYLHLHHLHKALADCNKSLEFGSMPDTLEKKEQIEKLLKSGK